MEEIFCVKKTIETFEKKASDEMNPSYKSYFVKVSKQVNEKINISTFKTLNSSTDFQIL